MAKCKSDNMRNGRQIVDNYSKLLSFIKNAISVNVLLLIWLSKQVDYKISKYIYMLFTVKPTLQLNSKETGSFFPKETQLHPYLSLVLMKLFYEQWAFNQQTLK